MRKKVLLVDDQPLDIALTRQALRDCQVGHEIVVACDGHEGLSQLRQQKFDLILLDLKMPKISGLEVLAEMRAQPALSAAPVIVLSNSDLLPDRVRAGSLGAVEYVHKAMEYPDFKNNLQVGLRRHGFC